MSRLSRAAVLLLAVAAPLAAQSRATWSIQLSGAVVYENTINGGDPFVAPEGQVRYTAGRWSYGLGVQNNSAYYTVTSPTKYDVDYSQWDVFFEPRYVFAVAGSVGFYAAGRLGGGYVKREVGTAKTKDNGFAPVVGGGAGALFKLTDQLALDAGFQLYTSSDYFYKQARIGLSYGLGGN